MYRTAYRIVDVDGLKVFYRDRGPDPGIPESPDPGMIACDGA